MSLGKRYEIYLPVEYNPDGDGNRFPIEDDKSTKTYRELWQNFRGVTVTPESQNQALRGFWLDTDDADEPVKDEVYTAIVYATDINKADNFFRQAISTYKERFQQKEILILSWIVERLE